MRLRRRNLEKIPKLAFYDITNYYNQKETEKGLILIKKGKIIKTFPEDKSKEEFFDKMYTKEAIEYLKKNPYVLWNKGVEEEKYENIIPKTRLEIKKINLACKIRLESLMEN